MTTRAFNVFSLVSLLASCLTLAFPMAREASKVGVMEVSIPPNRNDDQYYTLAAPEQSVAISDTVHRLALISMAKPLRSLLILALEICLLDRTNAAQPT